MSKQADGRLWGGCFSGSTAPCLARLNSSIEVDQRLYREDIRASQVYAEALLQAGVLTQPDCKAIVEGLAKVLEEWDAGAMQLRAGDEDVHTAVERRLGELVGEPAQRLHTGRSRNDQVATDLRLWLLNNTPRLQQHLARLIETIVGRARAEIDVLMPGYTHLQRAQPVRWSHFILSHAWSFQADAELLQSTRDRAGCLPLGSGALAGNPFPIDRHEMARKLGFSDISMNSMNAVGNRDFVVEFLFWCSLCGSHLSRLAGDLITFSSAEFGFTRVSDAFSTGSSLLPQKRNADGLELARAAAGALLGNCTAMLATLHALPSTYNKDLQADKRLMFHSFDTMLEVLEVVTGTIETLTVDAGRCAGALEVGQLATRLALWLVRRGLPFRRAHHAAGAAVARAACLAVPLDSLPEEERRKISEHLGGDLSEVWDYEAGVEDMQATGGTARAAVLEQIARLDSWLQAHKPTTVPVCTTPRQ